MKKSVVHVLCWLAAAAAAPALAQEKTSAGSELTAAQLLAKIQADRTGIVTKAMELTPEESRKFLPLYEQFQREMAPVRSSYSRAVLDYAGADKGITDANARRLAEQVLAAAKDEARLREKHFRQLLKVLPARKAARYVQIENKIDSVARYEAARAIPLVE
jgi:Spy/CpxP family protein refolding chaperone